MSHFNFPIDRRGLIKWAASAAAVGVSGAQAQSAWPAKPVTLIVPFPAGGSTGERLHRLVQAEGVPDLKLDIAGDTRESFTAHERQSGHEYRFVLPGPSLRPEEWQAALSCLRQLSPAPAWVISSGSLPPGVPDNGHAQIANVARALGARMVVDSSGAALAQALDAGVWLIKPSLRELSELTGAALDTPAAQRDAARRELDAFESDELIEAATVVLGKVDGFRDFGVGLVDCFARFAGGNLDEFGAVGFQDVRAGVHEARLAVRGQAGGTRLQPDGKARVGAGVAAVHEDGEVHRIGQQGEDLGEVIVDEQRAAGEVHRAQGLVRAVGLVPVQVGHPRAMARVLQHQHVARPAAAHQGAQLRLDGLLVVGGIPLESADGDRFGLRPVALLHTAAAASRLTGSVAGATQHAREHIRDPIDQIGLGVPPLANQSNVFRNGGVRRASPLAINDPVVIVWVANIGGIQDVSPSWIRQSKPLCGVLAQYSDESQPDLLTI